jgi:hypothetical protein
MIPIRTRRASSLAAAALAVLALSAGGCGGDNDDDDSSEVTGNFEIGGTLSYEFVPYNAQGEGLDYDHIVRLPIRGARVKLVSASRDTVIAETVSGDDGSYSFSYDGTSQVKLWVYAESSEPPIVVEDNTSRDEIYVMESEDVDASAAPKFDVVATTGWGGRSYTGPRVAAPFAILDAAYEAARRFLDETTPPPDFPELHINWSVDNRPEDGDDPATGQIVTSHWDTEELYILGQADVDTDEFDSHIIIHEWGHYFESTVGRSDSIGGVHQDGDELDPRVAFGEGWGNALGGIILDPDTVYTDSYDRGQSAGFTFDVDDNVNDRASVPGWYSETTVQAILYDLYDGADETYDGVALGLEGVYSAMVGGQKSTPALTTLFSFIDAVKTANPDLADEIDTLVDYHTADQDYGIDPIQDAWATGETHAADAAQLPLYPQRKAGDNFTVTLVGGLEFNKLGQNRYFRIIGDGQPVTVTSSCPFDVDLWAYAAGVEQASSYTESGNETITFSTVKDRVYVVNVQGFYDVSTTYTADIEIRH